MALLFCLSCGSGRFVVEFICVWRAFFRGRFDFLLSERRVVLIIVAFFRGRLVREIRVFGVYARCFIRSASAVGFLVPFFLRARWGK